MTKLLATNNGLRDQAIKVVGGTVTVRSGKAIPVEPFPDLDDDMTAHYAARGVTFSSLKKAKADAEAKAKAEADAAADKLAADQAAAALAAAEQRVEDALKASVDVGEDIVKKADADDEPKVAEAALAALKG